MQEVEFFRWLVPSTKPRGKPRLTSYFLSRQDAAERYPGAEPVLSSRTVRQIYESRDEEHRASGNVMAGIVAAGGGAK